MNVTMLISIMLTYYEYNDNDIAFHVDSMFYNYIIIKNYYSNQVHKVVLLVIRIILFYLFFLSHLVIY
jgi:hypothetical protein